MLTHADETDLLIPLHDATLGDRRFPAFLERLRRRTRALHVGLRIIGRDGGEVRFHAGLDLIAAARTHGLGEATVIDRLPFDRMRAGRVYTTGDFVDAAGAQRDSYRALADAIGIADERMIRITGDAHGNGWLVLTRTTPCDASDSALLSALHPHLAVALRCFAAQAHDATARALTRAALGGARTGTIGFDAQGRVVMACDTATAGLRAATGRPPVPGQPLAGIAPATVRRIAVAAQQFASPAADPAAQAVVLQESPPVEALLLPGRSFAAAGCPAPAMVALCRFPPAPAADRARHVADLYGLPPRMAELALLISSGLAIAEAAAALGLTESTARNYSKQIYAKLGLRGQAELTALICNGAAGLHVAS